MRPTRRDFLKLMLASAAAEAVDWEKLLWVPKPIVVVSATTDVTYWIGAINKASFKFWRNQQVGGQIDDAYWLERMVRQDISHIEGLCILAKAKTL